MIRHSLFVLALIAPSAQPQVHRADFSICTVVSPPPLGPPQKRISGTAPVSALA